MRGEETRPTTHPHETDTTIFTQLVQQALNFYCRERGQNLLEVIKRTTIGIVLTNVFAQQLLVGVVVKPAFASVGTLFAKGCI